MTTLPKIANAPFYTELNANQRYSWCTCGLSETQPFCDGKHKGSPFKSLPFQVAEKKVVTLCGCKKTKSPPYCDGSHEHS